MSIHFRERGVHEFILLFTTRQRNSPNPHLQGNDSSPTQDSWAATDQVP